MWELDCEESWAQKNWCFWTVVLEKTLESPSDCKEIQPVHPKGDQSWVFIGRTGVEAETPILWPPHVKSWLIGKHPNAGRDWGQEEERTEDEMAGWHHWLDGHGLGWTLGVGDRQGGLACCDSWGRKESDMTEWLNSLTETFMYEFLCGLMFSSHLYIYTRVELLVHMVTMCNNLENCHRVFQSGCTILHSYQQYVRVGSDCFTYLPTLAVVWLLDYSHPSGYEILGWPESFFSFSK